MEVQARNGFAPRGRQHLQLHGRPRHHPPAGDDEWWEYFPCPFCYIEVEVPFLCHHLQEEHCFDMRNAVCPICADNLGTDTAEHFRDRHSNLLKRRKSSSSKGRGAAAADKETCDDDDDDDSYLETTSYIVGKPVPDPLLSHFICTVAAPPPFVGPEPGNAEEEDGHASPSFDDQRMERTEMDDASRRDLEERLQRTEFVKQMLMTTIAQD
uniref:Uncharacterized protein n=1 Tax=Avena sativa TaxID=4498 RepID=A0ACD5TZ62_AVESA